MSRIHEALKRAEQERTAGQGGQGEASVSNAAVTTEGFQPAAPVVEHAPASVQAAMPSLGTPFTFDTLLARCAQANWTPDLKTMLFFNAEEQGFGTEEFRTLRSRLYQMRERQPLKKILVTS